MSTGAATLLRMPIRAVTDSNIIISALHRGGVPAKIFDLAQQGETEIYLSRFIIAEVADILDKKLEWNHERVSQALRALPARIINPGPERLHVVADAPDNRILECALAANAPYLITGDKGLLDLKFYRSIQILTPR